MQGQATEEQHPNAQGLQALPPEAVLGHLLDAQLQAAASLRAAVPALAEAATLAADTLRRGARVGYAGAGSSGLMALADCLELPGTYSIPPDRIPMMFAGGAAALLHMQGAVEDDLALAHADFAASGLGSGDAVICLSASGTTAYTLAIAAAARAAHVRVIGLANVAGSALLQQSDIAILLDTGAEIVAGSTRMAAGTAQKIALNLMSTLLAVKLGHVQDGYMVNLTADNAKLRTRAARIVARLSGVTEDRAAAALARTDGDVKTAVLVAAGAGDVTDAALLLADSEGHLGPALAALSGKL